MCLCFRRVSAIGVLGGDDRLKVIDAYPRGHSHYDMKRQGRAIPRVDFPHSEYLRADVRLRRHRAISGRPRSGSHFMVEEFITSQPPVISVKRGIKRHAATAEASARAIWCIYSCHRLSAL